MGEKFAGSTKVQRKPKGKGFQVTVPVKAWKALKLRGGEITEVIYDPDQRLWSYKIRE